MENNILKYICVYIYMCISWRRERLPTPVFWPGEFHGLYSPWGHKEWDTTKGLLLSLHIQLNQFVVHQKLTQHCKWTIIRLKKILYRQRPLLLLSLPCCSYITGCFNSCFIPTAQQSLLFGRWSMNIEVVAQIIKNLSAMQETQVQSLGREDPLEKETATHSQFLPGEFHGHRSLVGYSHGVAEKQTRLNEQHFFFNFPRKYRRNPTPCSEFKWNTSQHSEHFLFSGSGVDVRSEVVVDDSAQPLQGGESRQPSSPRTWEVPLLGQATLDRPFQGGLAVLGAFTGHRPLGSTGQHSLWVSLPGQGQPEFSRSRTILGNICTRGTTNTFVFFQHSLLRLSQTPPFLQQKAQPCEECSAGLWEVFALSKWGLALGICEIISRKVFSLWPTNGL